VRAKITQIAHHANLGKLAESIFSGSTINYVPDPQTGQIVPVQQKQAPGQLFRSILGGAMLGMAAGSKAHDFAGGFGAGGEAVIQQRQQQDQQRYARAQNQLENTNRVREIDQRQQQIEIETANSHVQAEKFARELDTHSPEAINTANDNYSKKQDFLIEHKAKPAQIVIGGKDWNGTPGNAEKFYQTFNANPDKFAAPTGYQRVESLHIDTNGLTYKPDEHGMGHWVDKDGNPVDMDNRTTITFYDTPNQDYDTPVRYSAADLQKMNPDLKLPEGSDYLMLSPRQMNAVVASNISDLNKTADTKLKNARASKLAGGAPGTSAELKSVNQQIAAVKGKIGLALQGNDLDAVDTLRTQLGNLYDQKDKLATGTSGTKKTLTPQLAQQYLTKAGGDKAKARQLAAGDGYTIPQQ
jgi:hypothetical protein